MRHNLEHVHAVRKRLASGRVVTYYYHRRTRKPIRGALGTSEFLASYIEAGKIDRPVGIQTLGSLIQRYRQSRDFASKALRTQRDYDEQLLHLDDIWGTMPLHVVDDRSFRKGIKAERDRLAERSERRADYFVTVLSIVLSYAVDDGALRENHAKTIGKLYRADRANKIWSDVDVTAFQAVASPELRLALWLALDTGQRQGDLLRLPWSAFDGGSISLRQSKTGAHVTIPCTIKLRAVLDATPRRSTLILTNSQGKPWTADGFGSSWRKACRAAAISGVTFNDLRGTAVTRLSEAGCTIPEIASITGHTLRSATTILQTYRANTKKQATAAIEKLDHHRRKRTP
jgi:integrase